MDLERATTIAACERALIDLARVDSAVQLRLPTNANYSAAGGELAAVQLLVTWAQSQAEKAVLQTYIEGFADDEQIERFLRQFHGLVAALACDIAFDKRGGVITSELKQFAIARLDQLQSASGRSASRGQQFEILCADGISRGTPQLLYGRTSEGAIDIRDRSDFKSVMRNLLVSICSDLGRGKVGQETLASNAEVVDALAGAAYELFVNTRDHGMTDFNRNQIRRSFRGIHGKHHYIRIEHLRRLAMDFHPLKRYFETLIDRAESAYIRLLELSVFDSGPGFAETWSKRPLKELSYQDELASVRECFSARSSKVHSGYGQGLPHVLRVLDRRRGFLRLRTGHAHFYLDCANTHLLDESVPLSQWSLEKYPQPAKVSGSLLTLILPLHDRP